MSSILRDILFRKRDQISTAKVQSLQQQRTENISNIWHSFAKSELL